MDKTERIARRQTFVEQVYHQLIVSCQALPHEPLYGAEIMARMAVAAEMGGAKAIRANTPVDVRAIRQAVALPIIGLYKDDVEGYDVYITPTLDHVLAVAAAGADIIAIDATDRPRPAGDLADFIAAIHENTDCLVMADISTLAEGVAAEAAGADLVGTTMSGYTSYSPQQAEPDLPLVEQLAKAVSIPVVAEGRYHQPEQIVQAFRNGATAAVVGGAITRPQEITARFVQGIQTHS
ncbi:MAG: N-acetylmannosamine-6-phosphate 2-epimerase [Caldilineaceae bacterium]|nr:N-acetylmannosamine-6-phosphate 2-epimerase [Caldilineaceae bacterium]